jgi:phospholipase C
VNHRALILTSFAATAALVTSLLAPLYAGGHAPSFAADAAAAPQPPIDQTVALLRKRVKHVFVIYQENRSFDSDFGTFPGAEGLYSHPAAQTPGFTQSLLNVDGTTTTVQPFRIGPKEYAADTDDIDHSHTKIVAKMNVVDGRARMDRFAWEEEQKYIKSGNPSLMAKQMGELAMAHEDCDTVPFLWLYAERFVLFDHVFQQMTGPSTPGNLAIIGAQAGETQWMLDPDDFLQNDGDKGAGVPVLNDANPFWGSEKDTSANKLPYNPHDHGAPQDNLTFPTLPLTLAGSGLPNLAAQDTDRANDYRDTEGDIPAIAASGHGAVPWGWYEEGFDHEPSDAPKGADPLEADGLHASYITHHNGPQYFGYVANNQGMRSNLHGLDDLFTALDQRTLPAQGVFYVKGGSKNIMGLKPADPDPTVQKNFLGDDDHPAYSDSQISEALVAETVNKIASSPYWKDSAIVITWDDSEGDYDHVSPPVRETIPGLGIVSDGPRIPLIVISPFARTRVIDHAVGDTGSVVKLVDAVFGLNRLASLPDAQKAKALAQQRLGIDDLAPHDEEGNGISNLLSAFDLGRLRGTVAPVPAAQAIIPERLIHTLPQQSGYGCAAIGIVPVDARLHVDNPIPADFNPRPKTNPTTPSP